MKTWKAKILDYPINDLLPYTKNQKKHSDTQIDKVAGSISDYGFTNPIGIDKNNVVIFGHCRLEAAKRLGMQLVPCIVLDHLTDKQIKALRIADNKLNESEWDIDFLKFDLTSLKLDGFDLEKLGFDSIELDRILSDFFDEPAEKKDPVDKEMDLKTCPNCGCLVG